MKFYSSQQIRDSTEFRSIPKIAISHFEFMWYSSNKIHIRADFLSFIGQSVLDSRCYLEGGGSAESLTASEDLKVGSIIGKLTFLFSKGKLSDKPLPIRIYSRRNSSRSSITGPLKINGNPRLGSIGNVSLSIRERDAPVSIAAGTKNLVLNTPLDREGRAGPSSIYINVICVRRDNPDPVSDMKTMRNSHLQETKQTVQLCKFRIYWTKRAIFAMHSSFIELVPLAKLSDTTNTNVMQSFCYTIHYTRHIVCYP